MYSEWELMAISEDIEPGDTVIAEDDSGEEELLIFVRQKNANVVILKDEAGNLRNFSTQSLEELGGSSSIKGKSSIDLRS